MANWVTINTTSTRYCNVVFQYDADDGGSSSRHCRLQMVSNGASVSALYFYNLTVDGSSIGTRGPINLGGVIWDGWLGAGSHSYSYEIRWYDIGSQWYSGSGNVPSGGTSPSTPTVTLISCEDVSAVINVSISSYGTPNDKTNRYIEAAVLGGSSYSAPRRFQKAYRTLSEDITVNNSSETDSTSLTIRGNTQYRIGGYASNTVLSKVTVGNTFITKPAHPTLTAIDQGHGVIDFTVSHATEGSADTVTEEYSIDGGTTWTTITGSAFSLTLASQTEVIVRRGNTTGYMTETVTVTPTFTCGVYASVINKTAAIKKVYASVGGEAKKVKKIYASVNGKTALTFEDPS